MPTRDERLQTDAEPAEQEAAVEGRHDADDRIEDVEN